MFTSAEDEVPQPGEASPAQQGIWLREMSTSKPGAFEIALAFHLDGPLDVRALDTAVQSLFRRHPVLQTTFHAGPDGSLTRRARATPQRLKVERGISPDDQDGTGWLGSRRGDALDLAEGPLLRFDLLELSQERHLLLLTTHHILLDGHSLRLLYDDLEAGYAAARHGRTPEHRLPERTFDDYVESLHEPVTPEWADRWRERIGASPWPSADFGAFADPDTPGADGEMLLPFPDGLLGQLHVTATTARTTLFTVALAALGAMLCRCIDADDVFVGVPVAARTRAVDVDVLGQMATVLPVRIRCLPGTTFNDLQCAVRDDVLTLMDERQPFERVAAVLGGEPADPSRPHPLVAVTFQVEPADEPLRLADLAVTTVPLGPRSVRNDLEVRVLTHDGDATLSISYPGNRYRPEDVHRIGNRFLTLLAAACADPAAPLERLPLEPPSAALPVSAPNHQLPAVDPSALIADLAWRTPDAAAVWHSGAELNYRQLNQQVADLTTRLTTAEPDPRRVVAISGDRTPAMVAAILACLRGRRPFLVINPHDPARRREAVLADAAATTVVQGDGTVRVTHVKPTSRPHPTVAYLSYTSGSTGRPRGVCGTRQGLFNYLRNVPAIVRVDPADRVLQLATPGFDAMLREVLVTLMSGACLVLMPQAAAADPAAILAIVRSQGVNVLLGVVPTLLRHVRATIETEPDRRPHRLRLIVTVGEALRRADATWVLTTFPGVRLLNTYGPTECTLTTTFKELDRHTASATERTVGRPIPGAVVAVLDRGGRVAPMGVPGELIIGGDGVAAGYHNDVESTRARFITVDLPGHGIRRMFRTGDRGRLRPDGEVEVRGRLDRMLKRGGVRIDPAEVESALARQNGVIAAFVVPQIRSSGDARLVGYVQTAPGGALDPFSLRRRLAAELPGVMVPDVLVPVEAMPRLANGKVDQRALAAVKAAARPEHAVFRPPATAAEKAVARTFAEVLDVDGVGLDDDFFNLGGHSLNAMTAVVRLRHLFGPSSTVAELFACPTVEQLAARLASRDAAASPARQHLATLTVLPLSSNQSNRLARHWAPGQAPGPVPQRNLVSVHRLSGHLEVDAVRQCLAAAMIRHEALRAKFSSGRTGFFQTITEVSESSPPDVVLSVLEVDDDELPRVVREECGRPFDMTTGPFLRGALFRTTPSRSVLVLAVEHIVADGQSADLIERQFWNDLRVCVTGGEPDARPPLVTYRDWVTREAATLSDLQLLTYWREELAGTVPFPASPFARPQVDHHETTWAGSLDGSEYAAALTFTAADSITPFALAVAALAAAIATRTGAEDLVIQAPVANRWDTDDLEIVGWLSNMVILRIRMPKDISFGSLCRQVANTMARAHRHSDVPFPEIVRALQPEHFGRPTPFRIMIGFHYADREPVVSCPGLDIAPFPLDVDAARWGDPGLAVQMYEDPDGGLRCTGLHAPEFVSQADFTFVTRAVLTLLRRVGADPAATDLPAAALTMPGSQC